MRKDLAAWLPVKAAEFPAVVLLLHILHRDRLLRARLLHVVQNIRAEQNLMLVQRLAATNNSRCTGYMAHNRASSASPKIRERGKTHCHRTHVCFETTPLPVSPLVRNTRNMQHATSKSSLFRAWGLLAMCRHFQLLTNKGTRNRYS